MIDRPGRASSPRLYFALVALYLGSRWVLSALGVRFGVDYDWQFFHDLDLLQDRLLETLLYTHAFTPFMDLLVGLVLKAAPGHAGLVYTALYHALSLTLLLSMAYLMTALELGRGLTLAVVLIFSLSPAFIYFESFLHYEHIAAALVCLSAALFHRALVTRRALWWFLFFVDVATVAYVRTTFHLVWVMAMVVLALACAPKAARAILRAAAGPVLLVLALYVKNQLLFGFFGTSSWFGFNLAIVTTEQLSADERRAWRAEGKLDPASLVPLYSGLDAYATILDPVPPTGIPVLDRRYRVSGQPNYNNAAYIELSQRRMRDAKTYLAEKRPQYLWTVLRGLVDYLRPTSRWHPKDPEGSPHRANRAVIGPWEDAWNTAFHRWPLSPVGLYVPMVGLLGLGAWLSLGALVRAGLHGATPEKLVVCMLVSTFYVPAVSCLVTIGELERYRFMVEAFMWIVALWAVREALARARSRRLARLASASARVDAC